MPVIFDKIKKFFLKPDFGSNPSLILYRGTQRHVLALDFLLWSWKSELSREWYSYLFGLKQDLQLNERTLLSERIVKTQTLPMAQYIKKN
ncbi:hypothetical protein OAM56_08500 [Alphaproteobacteria bacterium]|nr:hypothetical protein [Alphaproteobacteria bacterium]